MQNFKEILQALSKISKDMAVGLFVYVKSVLSSLRK